MPPMIRSALASYWPAIIWMGVIFFLSSVPGVPRPGEQDLYSLFVWLPPDIQNLLHVPVFGLLALLWQQAFGLRNVNLQWAASAAVALTVSYGFLDEWHQSFVFGRYASLTDVALDGVGALLAVLVGHQWLKQQRARAGAS